MCHCVYKFNFVCGSDKEMYYLKRKNHIEFEIDIILDLYVNQ